MAGWRARASEPDQARSAEVALTLAAAHFTERIEVDAPPQRARRPMTAHRAYATLCLVRTAPLAVAEASDTVLRGSAPTTEWQRTLDEAITRIRRIRTT